MTLLKQYTQAKIHQLEMKLTDAAIRGIHWNPIRAVIALSTLFTVYSSCVVLERNKRNLKGRVLGKLILLISCYSRRGIILSYTILILKSLK